jgi:hypothetical protein
MISTDLHAARILIWERSSIRRIPFIPLTAIFHVRRLTSGMEKRFRICDRAWCPE